MRKLIAIALVCAVASVASAQYENLMWARGSYSVAGGSTKDIALYQFDMSTGQLEYWTDLPSVGYGNGFADSGSKWYDGGASTLQVYKPTAQGGTAQLLSTVTLADLGVSSGTISDLEWANDELYMLLMTRRNIPVGEGNPLTTAASEFVVAKVNLDANGIPVSVTHNSNFFYSRYFSVDTLTGALAYNPDNDMWAFHGFVGPVMVSDDAESGVWTSKGVSFDDYGAALLWQGGEGEDLVLFARMQTKTVFYAYNGVKGSFTNLPSNGGFGDFARVLAIPEPATLALLAIGGLGIIARRRRNA